MSTQGITKEDGATSVVNLKLRGTPAIEIITTAARNSIHYLEPVNMHRLKRSVIPEMNRHEMETALIGQMVIALLKVHRINDPEDILSDKTKYTIKDTITKLLCDVYKKDVSYEVERRLLIVCGEALEDILKDYTMELPNPNRLEIFKAGALLFVKKNAEFLQRTSD